MNRKHLIWAIISIIAACVVAGALMCLAISSASFLSQQTPTQGLPTSEQSNLLESSCSQALPESSTAQETSSLGGDAAPQSQAEDAARETGAVTGQSAGQSAGQTQLAEAPKGGEAEDESKQVTMNSCTIEIRCDAILDHMDQLKDGYAPFVPADGFLLHTTTVTFTPGETVLDVLRKVTEQNGLQLLESGGYVQSIGYLMEGCCGRSSGWMYTVNGEVPRYGCGQYQLNDRDRISWQFVCDSADIITGG